MSGTPEQEAQNAVAIIGMSGRFPGASGVRELWQNLVAGVESVQLLSDDELERAGVPRSIYERPDYVKACSFLEDPDLFDAAFFDVTPREAELIDPQQRVFLECAWSAIEDAGYDVSRYEGSVGVFAGAGKNHYFVENLLSNPALLEAMGPVAATIASEKDFIATRVAYKLDLRGPSVSVQTACSTSLVAVHLACQSLLSFECEMALAGGVSISGFKPEGYLFVEGGIFSPDGHLRAFDARADGQIGGNGAAVVVLKRLEDALEDGDTIHAVIRGSALNNDGVRKVSFNAPGVDGQAQVVAEALEVAGVDPGDVGYVECHGTGTHLGDPIEVAALTQAFRQRTDAVGTCGIGSLKTNVGHLDAAAGAAGLIKAALSLEHECLVPSLHFETPNPDLALETSPFFVTTELAEWKRGDRPRYAGVSSFGMGGTNAHVVLSEAPLATRVPSEREDGPRHQLLVLSARTDAALDEACARLADHLESGPGSGLDLADVAFTTQVGRRGFAARRALACADRADAVAGLRSGRGSRATCGEKVVEKGRAVAFLFSGQGSQHANMLRGLYEREPVFRAEVDRCCEVLAPHVGRDLRELFYPEPGGEEEAGRELTRTQYTQPALFVVEYALARLWASMGVEPDAMLGHSIGEYVAACLAGVLSLDDALMLVAARGRLIGSLPEGGAMLSVRLSPDDVPPYLEEGVSVAVVNAPGMCVLAGERAALDRVRGRLKAEKVVATPLHTSHAFHSALMEPILDEFESLVRSVELSPSKRPIVSCSTGRRLSDAEATDPGYWVRHVREPVRFADGVDTLLEKAPVLLEVGPGQALTSLAKLCAAGAGDEGKREAAVVPSARHARREGDDALAFFGALGALWCEGVRVDWAAVHEGAPRRRVPLPTYPFERRRFWVEPGAGGRRAALAKSGDPADWFWAPTWRRDVAPLREGEVPARVLVFADDAGLGDALAERLRRLGSEVVTARAGGSFTDDGAGGFTLDLEAESDHGRLIDALADDGEGVPTSIVHLLGVDPAPPVGPDASDAQLARSFFGPMALVQALDARDLAEPVRISIVTSGMQAVLGAVRDPEKATSLGVSKAVDAECRQLTCRSVDLDTPGGPEDLEAAAAVLVRELAAGTEPVVAWRGGQRWLPMVQPVPLDAPTIPSPLPPGEEQEDSRGGRRLRDKAAILITGGYGGIGSTLAEGLARACGARVALLGRTGLPERNGWDAWLREHDGHDATARRIRAVRRIEDAGGEVLALTGDVARVDDVRAALDRVRERFGALHGVVHAAGMPGDGFLALKTRAAAERVLGPKVRGTRVLQQELRGEELDFFVLCSSLATALDGVGQADYFGANAFLDAFAAGEHGPDDAEASPVVSIGWDAWREVGMAAETAVPDALQEGRDEALRTGLTPDEGTDAFLRCLDSPLAHVLVSTRDLPARIEEQARSTAELGGDEAEAARPSVTAATHARPELAMEFVEPKTETERELSRQWADLLGIDRVGAQDDFFELGGNSLLLMQVTVRLRSCFDVSLSMRELFDVPTVASLAERVDSMRLLGGLSPGSDSVNGDTEELRL